ncbi:alpha/beta fold hydrolase [Streptomyces sp. bgisy095]|uniref:alpha/beta fold hydrolase n=1 Tax=unclassified Streptomyces TaxID=2593676 RepID=UPI003D749650
MKHRRCGMNVEVIARSDGMSLCPRAASATSSMPSLSKESGLTRSGAEAEAEVQDLAGVADNRYTLDLVPALRRSAMPKLLVWGEDDGFQGIAYAERFAEEMPHTELVRVPNAGHIPMENDAEAVAAALSAFFAPHGT